jgi:hypothetical protein
VSGPALVNYQSAQGWTLGPRPDDANTFASGINGDPKTPILQGYQGDPTRVHVVAAPGSEQMHVVNLGGMSFPLDPNLAGIKDPNAANNKMAQNYTASSVKLQNRSIGAFETLDATLDGGMGGPGAVKGDFVYHDRRLTYTQAGMWGLLRSLDKNLCTNLQALPGLPCAAAPAPAPAPAPQPAPGPAVAPGVPGAVTQQGFAAPSALTPNANLAAWTIPTQLSWTASTGTVNHYVVTQTGSTSSNLLTWTANAALNASYTTTAPAMTANLQVGKMATTGISLNKYSFTVMACASTDNSVCSAPSTANSFTLIPVDDIIVGPLLSGAGSIGYSGSWLTKSMPGQAYGGTVHYATQQGANALLKNLTFTVTGDVAWVSTLGPNMGIATVQVDNGPLQTIDLYAACPAGNTTCATSGVAKAAQVVWQTAGLTPGVQHTVKVTVTGTHNPAAAATSTNEVDVDAFVAIR